MSINRLTGYDRALMEIRDMVIDLAQGVYALLDKGLDNLFSPDASQNINWRQEDDHIDAMRDKILDRILMMMTLQQIRTQDLQFLLGYQRMAQALERIADYACDIAELALLSSEVERCKEVLKMAEQVRKMCQKVVEAIQKEEDAVEDLDQMDDFLDTTYQVLQQQFLANQNSKRGELGFALVLARTMERMGDHLLNAAEALVYIKTGKKL